jgi:hypothetical protein
LSNDLLLIYPVPAHEVAASAYEGLKDLAPYIQASEQQAVIILEEKAPYHLQWVHLLFNEGGVQEKVTGIHQWD